MASFPLSAASNTARPELRGGLVVVAKPSRLEPAADRLHASCAWSVKCATRRSIWVESSSSSVHVAFTNAEDATGPPTTQADARREHLLADLARRCLDAHVVLTCLVAPRARGIVARAARRPACAST